MTVTGFEIRSREPFDDGRVFGATGAYERLDGVLHLAVDPLHPANAGIVDLHRAARDAQGKVRFEADVTVLRPTDSSRANRLLLQDVPNRGGATFSSDYNSARRDPSRPANWIGAGDGFLMHRGWTLVSCGWQWDVIRSTGLLGLEAPEALENGRQIEGWVTVTHQSPVPATHLPLADRIHRPLVSTDLEQPTATLTVRDHPDAERETVPRHMWRFARLDETTGRLTGDLSYVAVDGGFTPGRIYEFVYRTKLSPVVGAGLLAFRDAATFFRSPNSRENPLAGLIDRTFAYGRSQSGRFLRSFLLHGLNVDEHGQQAFEGMHIHVAGARRGEFNHRYAQPSVQATLSFGHQPPFGYDDDVDPQTGEKVPGLLSRQRASGGVPKIIATNSGAEYWRGDAALLHMNLSGEQDLKDPPEARAYLFASAQHMSGQAALSDRAGVDGARGSHPLNVLNYTPLLRAALVNLEHWVSDDVAPPESCVPSLAKGTAVPRERVIDVFAHIPSAQIPATDRLLTIPRLELGNEASKGVGTWPAIAGERFPTLVSAVDSDGNEVGGIRLPDLDLPLASLTGWNPRHPEIGGEGQILNMFGSTVPFIVSGTERRASGDPRPSIEERYRDRDDYLARVRIAAEQLAADRYILDEDIPIVVENAGARWELLAATPVESRGG